MAAKKTTAKAASKSAAEKEQERDQSSAEQDSGETKALAGPSENKAGTQGERDPEAFQRRSVGKDKMYGTSSKEEHRRSGYILPDAFYEGEPEELKAHKAPGNGHGESEE